MVYLSSYMSRSGGWKENTRISWLFDLLSFNGIACTQRPSDLEKCDTFILFASARYLDEHIDFDEELERAITQKKRILLVATDEAFLVPLFSVSAKVSPYIWFADRFCSEKRRNRRNQCTSLLWRLEAAEIEHCAVSIFSLSEGCAESRQRASRNNGDPPWAVRLDLFINSLKFPYSLLGLVYPTDWVPDPKNSDDDLANLCRFLQASSTEAAPELPAAEPAEEKAAEKPEPSPAAVSVRRISSLIRESSGEIIELPEGVFYIGSDPLNCGYCLEMPDVRDRHVAFRTTLTDSHISEVGTDPSDAPSLINGETFTGLVRRLEHGDLITIGGENFIFRCL